MCRRLRAGRNADDDTICAVHQESVMFVKELTQNMWIDGERCSEGGERRLLKQSCRVGTLQVPISSTIAAPMSSTGSTWLAAPRSIAAFGMPNTVEVASS